MRQKRLKNLLEIHQFRLTLVQRDHIDTKDALHWGLFVKVIQDNVTDLALAQFDNNAHAILIGFVAKLADALNALVAYEVGNLFDKASFVYLVR
jgi:hypothetical protein